MVSTTPTSTKSILCLLPVLLALLLLPSRADAMHADEVGVNDFVLRTAGHGTRGIRFARSSRLHSRDISGSGSIWITSESNEYPAAVSDGHSGDIASDAHGHGGNPCFIAARNVTSGEVLWRVDACSSGSTSRNTRNVIFPRHATLFSTRTNIIYSYDDNAILRGWNKEDGGLLFDVDVLSSMSRHNAGAGEESGDGGSALVYFTSSMEGEPPRLLGESLGGKFGKELEGGGSAPVGTILVSKDGLDEYLILHNPQNGTPIGKPLSAKILLGKAKVSAAKKAKSERARILDMVTSSSSSADGKDSSIAILVGWSGVHHNIPSVKGQKVSKTIGSFSNMAWIHVQLTPPSYENGKGNDDKDGCNDDYLVINASPLKITDSTSSSVMSIPLLLSSLRIVPSTTSSSNLALLAISSSTSEVAMITHVDITSGKGMGGKLWEMDGLHPYWRFISSIHIIDHATSTEASASASSTNHIIKIAGIDDRYPTPRRIESLFLLSDRAIINFGEIPLDSTESKENKKIFHRVYGSSKGDEEVLHDALATCPSNGLVVTASVEEDLTDQTKKETIASIFRINGETNVATTPLSGKKVTWSSHTVEGDVTVIPSSRGGTAGGLVEFAHLVECDKKGMTVVFVSCGGMTVGLRLDGSSDGDSAVLTTKLWTSEEALGSVSSAIFLDETHVMDDVSDGTNTVEDEEEVALRNLQFSHRIQAQLMSLKNFLLGGGMLSSLASMALLSDEKKAERDIAFGFAKVSVMLSDAMHRIIALDTAKKGRVVWSMNLHPKATWNKIVRGGQFVSLSDPHGNGGVHDHEMMSLSFLSSSYEVAAKPLETKAAMEWKCFDGTSGRIFSEEIMPMPSDVVQIVPLRSSAHHSHEAKECRQVVLLVHADNSVSVVPDTVRSHSVVDEAISASGRNGLFVHTLNKQSGEFNALRVARKTAIDGLHPFELVTVGTTIFDPTQESIINISYPQRGEVIQSPSTVLGDDALLLKYLNPHLVAVVTEATPSFLSSVAPISDENEQSFDGFYNALAGSDGNGGQKRKPVGASKPGSDTPPATSTANVAAPSLFITLIDSVSGQILHRVSHTHANESDIAAGASTAVPMVISENWIVYAYFNHRTRRTDVGVLSLHEGMIDKNGLTAFNSPEQESTFSSLEAAKPIVLSKTYGLGKVVTALGVTITKAGISSKQFLFATGNDQVISIDRRLLDPRRPKGEVKESEKSEGLMR
ncbi:hypothetical protein ACHAXS_011390 [Conticribra weissflogii]